MRRTWLVSVLAILVSCDEKATQVETPTWDVDAENGAIPTLPYFEHDDFRFETLAPHKCEVKAPFTPKNGLFRLSFPVSITATSKRSVPVSPMVFTLLDEAGHKYRPTLAGCSAPLPRGELTAPRRVSGEVAFDVPETSGNWVLTFHPFLVGRRDVTATTLVPRPQPQQKGPH